ncbi:MAG: endonuclease domain-containing protein [Pseudonocardia sp.]
MSLDAIHTLLVRQAGVVSRAQAISAGLSADAVDHRLRTRRWRPLHPGVYLAAGHRLDDEARVRAALLWAGEGAALSGVAAAWWHGMGPGAPAVVGIIVPRRRRPRPRRGVRVRRRDVPGVDLTRRRGIALTAPALTALDAAVELGSRGGELLDRALQRTVPFPQVYAAYCRNLGAHGSATAARLLVAAADGSASVAERLLVRLLRDAGVGGWRCGVAASGFVLDVAFPAARLAVEVDGWAWHMDASRAQADKRRQNVLVANGWTILRYTWHDLVQRPREVVAEIRAAVADTGRLRSA